MSVNIYERGIAGFFVDDVIVPNLLIESLRCDHRQFGEILTLWTRKSTVDGERLTADAGFDWKEIKITRDAEGAKVRREGGPPRVFCKKRLQAAENKGRRAEKERQERQRGGNSLKRRELR